MAQNEETGIRDDALRIEITANAPPPVEAEFSIPGQSGVEEDEFVLPTTDKDKGNKFSAETQAAYEGLVAADRGVDPIQTYNELQGLPPDALTEQARQKYLDDLDVGIQQVLEAQLATQPPDAFAQDLGDATDFDASARQKAGSSTIPERRAVENISRLTGPEADEVEKKIINQMYFRRRVGEILHNQGYGEWAANAVGVLALSDESLDTGRTAAGGISRIDPEVLGAWLNSAGNWQKFVADFAQLSADEQREDFESIVETLRDTTDENAIKMAIHLLDLVDPTGADSSQAWHALDKLGLAGTVAGIAGRIARIFKAADLAKVAEQLDNVDLAATTVRVASVDAKAADAVGTTRFEAAEKIMPFDNLSSAGDTVSFSEWFRGSKIVDASDKPLVMYHGTTADFDKFKPGTGWFTASPRDASFWGGMNSSGARVIPAYLSIKRPLYMRADEVSASLVSDALTRSDIDGVIVKEGEKIVWAIVQDPDQIRFAIGADSTRAAGTTQPAKAAPKPFDNDVLLGGAPSDVAAKVVEQQNLITEYTKIADAVGGKFITQAEAELQAATALDRLEKVPNVRNVRVSSVTEDGFTLEYKVVTPGPSSDKILKQALKGTKVVDSSGVPLRVYHGTGRDFDKFNDSSAPVGEFYFTNDADLASSYASVRRSPALSGNATPGAGPNVRPSYLNLKNPLIVDAKGAMYDDITPRALENAKLSGKDGLIIRNVRDSPLGGEGGQAADVYVAFDRNQIYSAFEFAEGAPTSIPASFTKKFTIDDINGVFVDENMGITKATIRGVLSPNSLFQKNRTLLVNEPERLLRESAMAARKFKEATLQIFKGMSRESVQKVNAVLARGRDNGKVYSYGELVGNDILTKQEFEAYALSRHLFDIAFKYEDKMVRNRLMAKGVKEVEINDLKELLRPAGDIDSAKAMLRGASGRTVYIPDAVAGDLKYTELTDDILEKYYAQGYTLARADAGQYIATGAGKYADFALVKNARVRDLPPSVLHFNPGYAPISYKNGVYFVKSSIRGLVGNESKIVGLRTHRYFDSLKDANAFAEELRVAGYKDPTTGGQVIPKAEDVQVMHDRQMAQEAFEDDRIRIQGGLYTGARKGERLKFGLDGADAELVDPLIAMTTYLDHLARNYPAHLFRMKLEQTWMNTARARWGLPHTFKGTFKDAIKHISDGLSTTERAFAEKSHMQTLLQMNIPTTKERALRTWTRDFAERVEVGRGAPGLRRSAARLLHKVDNTDPVSIVTGAGFNLVLGMWNFSTMVVQGLGSTIPMAIHPLRAPLHLSSAMALGTMDKLADPNALKLARGRIGSRFKDMFPNEGYINDLHKSWSMSGLRETVLAGNPEYAALRTNLPYNPTLLGKFMNTHTIFYEVGEGFNFRYAWGAAFDWWKGQKGNAARKIDQSAVDEIRRRADTYLLHMNRANKSTIQTGAWRIPSQFTQIFFRFAEAVAGKELTMAEKARMLVGQSVLFGVAGVPLGTKVVDYTIERFGLNPSEETKDAVRSGAIQHFVQSYLGIDVDIAGRASIMKGFYDETMSIILGEESPGEVAFGATGGIVGLRSADAVSRIYNLGKTAVAVPDSEDIPPAIYSAVLDALLDMTSSWSNYTKAREVMVNKVFRDRNGGLLIRVGEDGAELNVQTKIAMALGLRYDQLNDIYIANMDNLKDRKRVTEKAASIVKTIDAILNESTTGESTEEQKRIVNLVFRAIMENETEDMRDRIRAAALDKLINPKSAADRVRRQQVETLINGGILGLTPSLLGDIPNGN